MRHLAFPVLIAAALSAGCSADQFAATNKSFADGRKQTQATAASSLGLSALASQTALFHVTAAMAQQAQKDTDNAGDLKLPDSDLKVSYQLDPAASKGHIDGTRADKPVLSLDFAYDHEVLDAGDKYTVSNLTGTLEGYQILLPRVVLAFSPAFDAAGQQLKDAKGNAVLQVGVTAHGILGESNQVEAQITQAQLTVQYPLPDNDTKVGAIQLTRDGLVFNGEIHMSKQGVSGLGSVSDASGLKLYDLAPNGKSFTVTPAQPPASASGVPSPGAS